MLGLQWLWHANSNSVTIRFQNFGSMNAIDVDLIRIRCVSGECEFNSHSNRIKCERALKLLIFGTGSTGDSHTLRQLLLFVHFNYFVVTFTVMGVVYARLHLLSINRGKIVWTIACWCMCSCLLFGVERCPLVGGWFCNGKYSWCMDSCPLQGVRYWECPFLEVPLYIIQLPSFLFLFTFSVCRVPVGGQH